LKDVNNLSDYQVQQIQQGEAANSATAANDVSVVPDNDIAGMLQRGEIEPLPEGMDPLAAFSNGR